MLKRFLLFMLIMAIPSFAFADELQARREIYQIVGNNFHLSKYEELNSLGAEYLDNQSRTSSGLWKLALYYFGLSRVVEKKFTYRKYWSTLKKKVKDWQAIDGSSSFAHMFYVDVLTSEAWMHRGSAVARKVKKEAWKPFYDKIEEASLYLDEHKNLSDIDPQWYRHKITIAIAQGWEMQRFYALIDDALSKHPQYYEIYFKAIMYLMPKWYGSDDAIERFASYAVKKSREQEGYGLYARIYWYAAQTEYGDKLFTKSNVRWNQMKLGIQDVIKRYPDQWNINNFAYHSCLARDKRMTKELLSMIKGKPMKRVWGDNDFYASCVELAGQP